MKAKPSQTMLHFSDQQIRDLLSVLSQIPGGYEYLGAASTQLCFPLKEGGELRFSWVDDDVAEDPDNCFRIDLYNGALSRVGVTGLIKNTG